MKKLLLLLFIFSVSVYSQTEIFQLSELKKGMKGEGYTVVEGDKIEKFQFEIITIMDSTEDFGKMILAKLWGEPLAKSGGISEGMSGSPMYIDGKLIGALSYTLDYETQKTALITPIECMLAVKKRQKENYLTTSSAINEVEAGTAISITPVRGDISFDTLGTITLAENGEFWALGHAFNGKGNIKYFLNKAQIDYSVKNLKTPFKLGHSTQTIGMVTQDRTCGIYGILTEDIPIQSIEFNITRDDQVKKYTVEIIKDRVTFEVYLLKIIENLLYRELDADEYTKLEYDYEILNQNGRIFYDKNIMYYSENLIGNFAGGIAGEILEIVDNPFEYLDFEKIVFNIDISKENKLAYIKKMEIENTILKPGDKLNIEIEYLAHQNGMKKQKIELKIPENFKVGNFVVELSTGIDDGKYYSEFKSLGEMLRYYRERQKNNEIGLKIKGEANNLKTDIHIPIGNYIFSKYFVTKDIIIDSFEAENDANEYFRKNY